MVGLLGPAPPGVSTCGGEGLDKAPLAVLLGVGAQALWLAGKVLGGSGPPQFGVPHVLHGNLMDRPLASTLGTSPELMEPETSNHSIQLPALTGGLPRLHELSPTRHAPKMTCKWVPQCLTGGTSLLLCLPPAVGMTR